jgi:hypothetical protein
MKADKNDELDTKAILDKMKRKRNAAYKKYSNNKAKRINRYFDSLGM